MKTSKLPLYLLYTLVFIVAIRPAAYAVDGCSSASFKVAPTVNLEAGLFGLATADFNGDGHLDLVAIPNVVGAEVLLLLGRGGTEKFGPPRSVSLAGRPQQVAVGDFNGDSKPDLFVTIDGFGQSSGLFVVLLNDGTGNFAAPITTAVPGQPSLPALADLNNDGKLDVVTGLFTGNTENKVAALLGNGAGGFAQAANSPFVTNGVNNTSLILGDFNEDNKPDLAMPGQSFGVIAIRLGDGAGSFGVPENVLTGGSSALLTAGHFNHDGHLDILSGDRMMLGTGTGSFNAPITLAIPANINAAIAGDVNNDTHLDLVAGAQSGLTIFLGNGAGNLTQAKAYTAGVVGFVGRAFAHLGDFNEDGKMDIAAAMLSGIGIMDGDGTGAFYDALSYNASISSPGPIITADFNTDGKRDFAALSQSSGFTNVFSVEVALGNGAGGFTKKSITSWSLQGLQALAAADFTSDGKPDLAVVHGTEGRVYILTNDGTGGFPAQGFPNPNFFVGFQASAIKPGDFNNDGKADLIVITAQNNSFAVMLGDGSGGFTIVNGVPLQGTFSVFDDVDVGDFNNDGKQDFAVVRSGSNTINVLQGNGAGQFSNYASAPTPAIPVSVIVRDLNGDGKPDVAATSSGTQGFVRQAQVTVLINNGAGGFNTGVDYPTGEGGGSIAAGDFNNDGQPDLVVSSGFTQMGSTLDGVAVLTNKGNGQFNAWTTFPAGQQSGGLVAGDFNTDNKDDVLFTQPVGQSVALLLNDFSTAKPCLSISDATVTETDSGTTNAVFTVTLSSPSAQTVKVNYFFHPGPLTSTATAVKGVDFEPVVDTVTFLPGETSKPINIPVKGDLIDEFDQFFFIALTTPINALISDGKGIGTIVDNDAPPTISVNDVSVVEGTQTQSIATFAVTLSSASEKPVSVQFGYEAGTATNNVDYVTFSGLGTLEFEPGQTTKNPAASITQDNIFEPDETFFINLSNPTNATIADGQGQATITNDDPLPAISVAAQTIRLEGAQGTSGNASIEVRLSNPSFQTITVAFATANATATAGSDYIATSGTVTFNPGETVKTISVEVTGDNVDEINEIFLINLTNPANATIGAAQGSVLIQDDDGPTLSIGNASVTEGNIVFTNAVFTVTLSAPSVQEIFVNYSTASGTATTGIDLQQISSNTLVIPAGATSATITIRVFGDFQIENDETFSVNLQFPTNASIAPGQGTGTGTILNDDSNGKLQFSSATYNAAEDQDGFVVVLNRVNGATGIVKVDFATSNGTATAGSDYPATTGTLTLNQGETSKSFFIAIVSDSVFEGDETFNLTLSNPTGGAVLGTPTTAVMTIESPTLLLLLEDAALDPNQVAAVESLSFTRDPFLVISPIDLFGQGLDRNTRVLVFVSNLQLAPNDTAATVRISLVDSGGQTHDIGAEDVRVVPLFEFTQIKFRLPDNLPPGACTIKIKAHDQESNAGTIRIRNP